MMMMVQKAAGKVMMGEHALINAFNFRYLGFHFQAVGDRRPTMWQSAESVASERVNVCRN